MRSKLYAFQLWNQSTNQRSRVLWYHGRVYEWRCDISYDGKFVVFFATVPRPSEQVYGVTGVCKAPWGAPAFRWTQSHSTCGGGVFIDPRTLHVNIVDDPKVLKCTPPADACRAMKMLPFNVETSPFGLGDDDPSRQLRFKRDGWWCIEEGGPWKLDPETGMWPEVEPIHRWAPPDGGWHIDYIEQGYTFEQRPGGGYLRRYVMSTGEDVAEAVGAERLDHVIIDRMHRLIVAADGFIRAYPVDRDGRIGEADSSLDFNKLTPEDAQRTAGPSARSTLRRSGRSAPAGPERSGRPPSSNRIAARRSRRGGR
ncbi:MAG: hypothetical protein KAS72_14610 [Phycisphaerales bacterium]|nr:hypothetical protein [Phycisphaerales bacterium]